MAEDDGCQRPDRYEEIDLPCESSRLMARYSMVEAQPKHHRKVKLNFLRSLGISSKKDVFATSLAVAPAHIGKTCARERLGSRGGRCLRGKR